MNWYKLTSLVSDKVASSLASLLVNSFYGMSQDLLDKIANVVASLPDEASLQDAINKAINLTIRTTKQDSLTIEQAELLDNFRSAFQTRFEAPNKIEPVEQPQQQQEEEHIIVPEEPALL